MSQGPYYSHNKDGLGIGKFECDFNVVYVASKSVYRGHCVEIKRCGPVDPKENDYIECGGVYAFCGNQDYGWGSLEKSMVYLPCSTHDEHQKFALEYSIIQRAGDNNTRFTWTQFQNGVTMEQVQPLANLCKKN